MPGSSRSLLLLLACCALSACGKGGADASKPEADPALTSALADPLMLDPDLSSQNRAVAAIAVGGPPVAELPLVERSPQAIEDARDEARQLAGGSFKSAPQPQDGDAGKVAGVTAAQVAAAVPGVGPACAGKAEYGMGWSLSLPEPLAIFPRGHVQEAAGSDRDGCRLRSIRFLTPVDAGDVVDFYFTRLSAAGLEARHLLAGEVHVLEGSKGGMAYAVHVQKLENGLSRVDLVSNGG
jgi:hypothetical protein